MKINSPQDERDDLYKKNFYRDNLRKYRKS